MTDIYSVAIKARPINTNSLERNFEGQNVL